MIDIVRQEVVHAARTMVVKIGTNVLTGADGSLDRDHLSQLAEQIAEIHKNGKQVVIVSSGAIGAGLGRLGIQRRPTNLPELQAAAAIGQCDLMDAYNNCLRPHGFHAAQLLLTAADFNDRARYLNARNTIFQLLRWNAIPIINENDTISVAEIRFGDNDQLAAMVTNLLRAPLLVILSVVDGLYAHDPATHPDAEPIDTVLDLNDAVQQMAGSSTSGLGTGGMRSKLTAARIATSAGEAVWIASGREPDVLRKIVRGERIGTLFTGRGESKASWKRWIGYTARPQGAYVIDDGAETAIRQKGKSLLAVGVKAVRGDFAPGEVVAIESLDGREFARGLTNYSSDEARRIMGHPTSQLEHALPGARYDEVIHRANLTLLDD